MPRYRNHSPYFDSPIDVETLFPNLEGAPVRFPRTGWSVPILISDRELKKIDKHRLLAWEKREREREGARRIIAEIKRLDGTDDAT